MQKFTPICFYKRPILLPVFSNCKKSKEDFSPLQTKVRSKNSVQRVSPAAVTEAARTWAPRPAAKPLPQETHAGPQHQAAIALSCVRASVLRLSLSCASVSKTCPEVIASSLSAISACRIHGKALLSESGGKLHCLPKRL